MAVLWGMATLERILMSRNHYMSRNYAYDAGRMSGLSISVTRNGGNENRARFDFSTFYQSLSISLTKADVDALGALLVEILQDWQ